MSISDAKLVIYVEIPRISYKINFVDVCLKRLISRHQSQKICRHVTVSTQNHQLAQLFWLCATREKRTQARSSYTKSLKNTIICTENLR